MDDDDDNIDFQWLMSCDAIVEGATERDKLEERVGGEDRGKDAGNVCCVRCDVGGLN